MKEKVVRLFLSRKNLTTLLGKLNHRKGGGFTHATIIKYDNTHPTYPQSHPAIIVTAVEDEDYYTNRTPGEMLEYH